MLKARRSLMKPSAKSARNCVHSTCWRIIPAAKFPIHLSAESRWSSTKKILKGRRIRCAIAQDITPRRQGRVIFPTAKLAGISRIGIRHHITAVLNSFRDAIIDELVEASSKIARVAFKPTEERFQ